MLCQQKTSNISIWLFECTYYKCDWSEISSITSYVLRMKLFVTPGPHSCSKYSTILLNLLFALLVQTIFLTIYHAAS